MIDTAAAASEAKAADKRLFPRRRARASATFRPAEKIMAPCVRVNLLNISHGGAQFTVCRELTVGQRVVLELQATAGATKPLPLEAVVRWVQADAKLGEYRIGCAWAQRLDFFDLQRFS